ncbi:hypothetical protein Ancab_029744 [Ancistrocladus abbreviatus]
MSPTKVRERDRTSKLYNTGNDIHTTYNNGGGCTSVVPRSLSLNRGNGRLVTPKISGGNGSMEASNSPFFNDDSLCNQTGHGQSHCMVLVERKSGKSSSVEPSASGYMSSPKKTSAGTFIEDETDLIKKGEDEDILASSTDKQGPVSSKKVRLHRMGEGFIGPTLVYPSFGLDQHGLFLCEEWAFYPKKEECLVGCSGRNRPKCDGANSSKPKRVSLNRKQVAPKAQYSSTKKARSVFNHRGEKANDAEISSISLRYSNIENMNRLFLFNLNCVSVEEIWHVRKRLGIRLTEEDATVIQHIIALQN